MNGRAAFLQGVKELRAIAVTKPHLQSFREFYLEEMRTYMQAELAPVRAGFKDLTPNVGKLRDRVDRLATSVRSCVSDADSTVVDPRDPAFRRMACIDFSTSLSSRNLSKQWCQSNDGFHA